MRIRLTNSKSNCGIGQRLSLGIYQGSNGNAHRPEIVDLVVKHWVNDNGRISFALALPKEPATTLLVGTANQGTRNGEAETIQNITSVTRNPKGLIIAGKNGVVLKKTTPE